MMALTLLAALGGAIGAAARYLLSLAAARAFGLGFPWGTLSANALGGLAMGLLVAFMPPERRGAFVFLGTGVLGGFTTFSAFSLETVRMLEDGAMGPAMVYAAGSVLLCVGACALGLMIGREFS